MIGPAVHRGVIAAVCAGVLSVTSTASAQDDAFRKAFGARNDRRWADVAAGMQAATKVDPKESPRKVREGGILGIGARETEYLPYFYLGEAHFNRKNCAGAIVAWETSEQQGVIRTRTDLQAIMQEGYRACAGQGFLLSGDFKTVNNSSRLAYDNAYRAAVNVSALMEKYPAVVRPEHREEYGRAETELTNANTRINRGVESRLRSDFEEAQSAAQRAADVLRPIEAALTGAVAIVTRVERQFREVTQLIENAETLDESLDEVKDGMTPELQLSRTNAREQLRLARERAAAAQRSQNPAGLDEAVKYVQSATASLNAVLEGARRRVRIGFEQRFGSLVKAVEERFSFLDTSMAALDRLSAERPLVRPDLAERRDAIRKDAEALRRRYDRARASEDIVSLERVRGLAEQARAALDELLKSFGPLTLRDRGVDQALEEGARLFFAGEYRGALLALDPPGGLPDIPLQLHVHLLRAAASYALWVLSGGSDPALRAAALKEVESCKRLDSTFRPDPRRFSPAFISFYEQAGAAAQAAAPNSPAR